MLCSPKILLRVDYKRYYSQMEMSVHAPRYFQNLMECFHSCTQEILFLKFDITRRLKVTDPEAYLSSNIGVPFKSGEVMLGEQAPFVKWQALFRSMPDKTFV